MFSISKLIFVTVALTTFASSKSLGNHVADLSVVIAETGLLPPAPELTTEAEQEYMAILTNSSQTIPELEQNTKLWAEKHGLTEKLEEYNTKVLEKVKEFKDKYMSVINNILSAEKKYQDILNSQTLTMDEISNEVDTLLQQYPLEFKTLGCLFDEMLREMKENSSAGDNQQVLNGIQSKHEVMKAMKFLRRK
ncbi:hypothetical protein CRE_04473 [Caenorhabditis remanei]|uniref:SXP/RAL-2 family protein Ani s 5-like cation-binding domain-containing protein n=2 Tax=Caenorhabditis remanei TaxID=31234 RepID=E3M7J4_CAERE|nr:hypothetical protein CRE_12744 [Caenorhabditis remanei]EFO96059.1 hypothetical protein CRE_04473 [Caenorhabditis remanei]